MPEPAALSTARLKLHPATVAHARAEIDDRAALERLLQARVPENWPPESSADALPLFLQWLEAAPDCVGWFGWYALADEPGADRPVLVGSAGFLGPPGDGKIAMGYSLLPQFQRRGYATEMASGLVQWALRQPAVDCIVAETEWANPASVRVLDKLGFTQTGAATEQGGLRFELRRSTRPGQAGQ